MFRELLSLFNTGSQERRIADDLDRMIRESADIVRLAGDVYLRRTPETPSVTSIKQRDKSINKLQRQLRKDAFGEAVGDPHKFSLPFCLSVMNIVKDVERIGDYSKDLAELAELTGPSNPSEGLPRLVSQTERFVEQLSPAMREGDQIQAVRLIDRGKDLRREFQAIQNALLTQQQAVLHAPADALALQFYIRIISHSLNVLSTLVTPLHHMDYVGRKDLLPEVKQMLAEGPQKVATEPG